MAVIPGHDRESPTTTPNPLSQAASAPFQEDPGHGKNAVNGSLVHITAIFGFTLCGLVIEAIYNSKS